MCCVCEEGGTIVASGLGVQGEKGGGDLKNELIFFSQFTSYILRVYQYHMPYMNEYYYALKQLVYN